MAISLQLAMIDKECLEHNSARLDDLLNFNLLHESCYLDGESESIILFHLLKSLDLKYVHLIFEGLDSFLTFYDVEQQPKSISQTVLLKIHCELQEIEPEVIDRLFSTDLKVINKKYGLRLDRPVFAALNERFNEIKDFIFEAVKNNKELVVWWD